MILPVFLFFMALSLALVVIGFAWPEHSEISILGFIFMFLLALVILNNGLTVKTGVVRSGNFSYNSSAATPYLLNASVSEVDVYATYADSTGFMSAHNVGFYMAVVAVAGFAGVLFALRRGWGSK